MKIGVLKEVKDNEKRVAITPSLIPKIKKLGYEIYVESNSGLGSNFHDRQYNNGAVICTKEEVFECDIILLTSINPLIVSKLSSAQTFISFFSPATNPWLLKCAKKTKLTYYLWTQCQEFQEHKKWMHYHQWQMLQAQELS